MSTPLRRIVLVGPRLAGATPDTLAARAYAWVAELVVAYQGPDRADRSLANSTLGIRVVLQSAQPDVGPGLGNTGTAGHNGISVPLMSPQLMQVVAGPLIPKFGPVVHLNGPAQGLPSSTSYPLFSVASLAEPDSLGMDGLLVAPEETWPLPQFDAEIQVPYLRLVEGRLSVLIEVTAPPGAPPSGFLGLVPDPATGGAFAFTTSASGQVPFVRLSCVDDARVSAKGHTFVCIDLTPEGIEFEAWVANPRRAVARTATPAQPELLKLRLRLANRTNPVDDGGGDAWALVPVDDADLARATAYAEIRGALDVVQDAVATSRTLQVGIDTQRPIPSVCWPLTWPKGGSRPVYLVDKATTSGDWCLELTDGVATMLAADPDIDGDLPTTADIAVDRLRLTAMGTGSAAGAVVRLELRADRRRAAAAPAATDLFAPPDVVIVVDVDSTSPTRQLSVRPAGLAVDAKAQVAWTLDESALAADLVARYARAGVQPARVDRTYAFMPVSGGWLQWPLRLPLPATAHAAEGRPADTARLDGELFYALDAASAQPAPAPAADVVSGRYLRVTACDYVIALATISQNAADVSPRLASLRVEMQRCTGEASGLLWFATSSPTPAEILPSLAAGPLALQSAWLGFGQWARPPQDMGVLRSAECRPVPRAGFASFALMLNDPSAPRPPGTAVLWKNADGLPVVTAVPMTRTSDGGSAPLSTRQLMPRALDLSRAVTLAFGPQSMLPAVNAFDTGLLHADAWEAPVQPAPSPAPEAWSGVPLVAVTLPGIEFKPGTTAFAQRQLRLQFGLPVLDELWTLARLPQTDAPDASLAPSHAPAAGVPAAASSPVFPTSLDLAALRGAWLSARDRLMLTRTQAGIASPGWMRSTPASTVSSGWITYIPADSASPGKASNQAAQTVVPMAVDHLVEGASWSASFRLTIPVQIPVSAAAPAAPAASTYPFGSYDIGGHGAAGTAVTAAGALAGYSGRFRLNANVMTPVAPGPDAPSTLVTAGFAAALVATTLDGRPAWRDTRGAITARRPHEEPTPAIILRDMGSAFVDGFAWQRATLREALTIAVPGGPALTFWCRDLPLARQSKLSGKPPDAGAPDLLAFRPDLAHALGREELAIGPTPDALGSAGLPSSTYEWRFAAAPAGPDAPARYAVPLGPLSLRPLRLVEVTLTPDGLAVGRLAILGTLAVSVDETPEGPFGDDMACDAGSPVVLTLDRQADGTFSLETATWSAADLLPSGTRWSASADATVTLRLSGLDAHFGAAPIAAAAANDGNRTSALLTLVLAGNSDARGRPAFKPSATADVVLLGQRVHLAGGTATLDDAELSVAFGFDPASAGRLACSLALDSAIFLARAKRLAMTGAVTLRWDDVEPSTQAVKASLAAVSLALHRDGIDLTWLNHTFAGMTADVDHGKGLLTIDFPAPGAAALQAAFSPVAGIRMANPTGHLALRIVFASSPVSGPSGLFGAACALGLLDFAASSVDGHGVTGFRHVVRLDGADASLSSEIEVDVDWTTASRIEWPLDAVPATPGPILADVSGRVARIRLQPDATPRAHRVRMVVMRARLDTALLCPIGRARDGLVALERPWVLRARVRHEIRRLPADVQPVLAWTAIDHVVIAGTRALLEAALVDHVAKCATGESRAFAFEARYLFAGDAATGGVKASPSFAKAGLGLRQYALAGFPTAPVAGALLDPANTLAFGPGGSLDTIGGKPWADGLVVNGAGPVTIRLPGGDTGFFLALPWLASLTPDGDDSFLAMLPSLHQAGPAALSWDVPDIDAAAGSPQHLSFAPPVALALGSDVEADLVVALDDALASVRGMGRRDPGPSRALLPVEQVELRAIGAPVPVQYQPLWLRSLLTLRAVLPAAAPPGLLDPPPVVEQIVVSGHADGIACRLSLKEPAIATAAAAPSSIIPAAASILELIVLGRDGVASARLGAADMALAMPNGQFDATAVRARLLARADTLVDAAICVVLALRPDAAGKLQWSNITVPALRDDPLLAPPVPLRNERAFASPHLGWPMTGAPVARAAAASLGMGDDRPFQDPAVALKDATDRGDVKTYGSGFSGRVAALSLPARADAIAPKFVAFYVHGHKTLLLWPAGLTLAAPPARHLTASHARLRLPGLGDSMDALHAFDADIPGTDPVDSGLNASAVQPMVPLRVERTTYGSRPGAMHLEFDGLALRAWNPPALADNAQTPAFPGHAGPLLARQVRTPRGVEFPRLPLLAGMTAANVAGAREYAAVPTLVETHGRRTFVAVDDVLEGTHLQPRPFRLFDGVANVLRIGDGPRAGTSLHFVVRRQPTGVGVSDFTLKIDVSSPGGTLSNDDLMAALVEQGIVPEINFPAPSASLTVGNASIAFGRARINTDTAGRITLVLGFVTNPSGAPPAGANAVFCLLETADGDTPIVLMFAGTSGLAHGTAASAQSRAQTSIALCAPDDANTPLAPEPRSRLAFRLALQPRLRASMAVNVSTLVFGDPAYDRLLSGPGAGNQQRDAGNVAWKFAFDRFVYSLDTPLYFAFGSIVTDRMMPKPPMQRIGTFAESAQGAPAVTGRLQVQRLRRGSDAKPTAVFLGIAGTQALAGSPQDSPSYAVSAGQAYALTLDTLRTIGAQSAFDLQAGDLLTFSLTIDLAPGVTLGLTVVVALALQSVVPPSPAVYSLVTTADGPDQNAAANGVVALHAARPLPQRIDLPHLVDDLALGHIRRAALFQWGLPRVPPAAVEWATLVKIDSAGGGQVPVIDADIAH